MVNAMGRADLPSITVQYRILALLGAGGTGAVYRALDMADAREVALKVLHPRAEGSPPGLPPEALEEEFRVLSSLSHPNLAEVHDWGLTAEGQPFFTMELLDGEDLKTFVGRRLPRGRALARAPLFREVLIQALSALDYIHTRKVVHDDLKPSNILILSALGRASPRPVVKIIDFGLARASETSRRGAGGTVEYMAPEKVRGAPADPRSDLYSLGAILFELFTGDPPFQAPDPLEVVRLQREGRLSREKMEGIPEPFRGVIERLLAPSPADRLATAHEALLSLFGAGAPASALLPAFGAAFAGREGLLGGWLGGWIAALERDRSGRGPLVLIQGESGIGKSRLLRELRARLQLRGVRVLGAACRSDGSRPGEALGRLVAAVAAGLPPDSPRRLEAEKALDLLGGGSPGKPAGRPPVGGPPPGGLPALGGDAERERLVLGAADLILSTSEERPTAVLIDDCQWADTLDLSLALHLLRRMAGEEKYRLAVFLAARGESEQDRRKLAEIEALAGSPGTLELVTLPGLPEEDIRAYLAQVLGSPRAFPESLPRALWRDTGGNPFFIEETLKLLAARGGIVRDGARWLVTRDAALETPRSIQEVIRTRVEALSGLPAEVLSWAAVLDEPFTAKEVGEYLLPEGQEASSLSPSLEAVESALRDLVHVQLLGRDGKRHALAHRLVGAAVYQGLPEEERRRRHRRIGESILAEGKRDSGRRLERLSHHLYLSDRPESAREHLLEAGARAQRCGALREAAGLLSRALTVIPGEPERFRVLLQREQVWGLLADRDRQLEDLRELARLQRALDDPRLRAEALVREAVFLDGAGRKRECLEKYDLALSIFREAGDRRGEARVLGRRAMVRLLLGEFETAFADLDRALSIARAEGDLAQAAEVCQMAGVGLYFQGRYDKALTQLGQALSIRRDLGEEHRVGTLESNIGLIQFDRGDFEAAEERFKTSLKISRAIGFRRGEAVNLVNLGLTYSEMGRYERALDFIGEALRIRRELGDRWGEGTDLGNLGAVYLRLGRFERAVPLIEQAILIARESGNRGSEGSNECRLGMVEMRRGELDRAEGRFLKGKEIAAALRLVSLDLASSTHLARLALLREEPEQALLHLQGPLRTAREARMESATIECLSLEAQALLARGKVPDALRASGEAVGLLRRFRGWMERSHQVWLTRSRALAAAGEAEAPLPEGGTVRAEEGAGEALRLAHAHLMEKAEAIRDEDLRASYLRNLAENREILEAFTAQKEAARREASLRERSFYEIARSINSILEIEPLLDRLLDLAVETTRAEKGMILIKDPQGRLMVKAARDMAQESIADAAEICQSVTSDVSRRGEAILASDAAADERFRERKSIIDFRIRSLMCVPLTVRGELMGAVYVDTRGETAFGQEDLTYLTSFAHLAAIAIDNARLLSRLKEENLYLRREVETRYRFGNIIGASGPMRELFATMEKVARTPAGVLITGETGTGKELIARAIHYHGPRKDRPFVAVDCGALPESLLESELFGHRRGAFSGALHDRVGLFEEAQGGTIFLDEITNTSPDLQAKLLRVLQEGEVRRVGENHYRKVDVRVIAATNLPIEKAVDGGRFREDLYYRLNVIPLRVPPLRERREDIPLLAAHFMAACGERLGRKVEGFTEEAMALLTRAPWRGNVRELEHAIEKALILADRDRIGVEGFPDLAADPGAALPSEVAGEIAAEVAAGRKGAPSGLALHRDSLAAGTAGLAGSPFDFGKLSLEDFDQRWLEMESAYLRQLVARAEGNFSKAARLARVRNRNTLIARLKRHGIGRQG